MLGDFGEEETISGRGEYQSLVVFLGGRGGKDTTSSISGDDTACLAKALALPFAEVLGTSGADTTDLMETLGLAAGGISEAGVKSLESESDEVTISGISAGGSRHDHSLIDALALFGSKAPLLSVGRGDSSGLILG